MINVQFRTDKGAETMANMDIDKIIVALKKRFAAQEHFIFWYDDNGDFLGSLEAITKGLQEIAEVVTLNPGCQLMTKQYLLNLPTEQKVLIYSPAPEPALEEDHLRNIVLYSGKFSADSREILRKELGLPESLSPFMQKYITFFGNARRRKRFKQYDVGSYEKDPELGIMATLVHLNQPIVDFFSILQLLINQGVKDNPVLIEFGRYGVLNAFWAEVEQRFGYVDVEPQLEALLDGLYVTATYQQMGHSLPQNLGQYDLSAHQANVQTFIQQFSNRRSTNHGTVGDDFDSIAKLVWQNINGDQVFGEVKLDDLVKADIFPQFDWKILLWMQERLISNDLDVQLDGKIIPELIRQRLETHFGSQKRFSLLYRMIRKAWYLIRQATQPLETEMQGFIDNYVTKGYRVDTDYRKFTYYYQHAKMPEQFAQTKKLVESIYITDYLNKRTLAWNERLDLSKIKPQNLQRNFYQYYVAPESNRIVVIISDAFRFEAAKELEKRLRREDQVKSTTMQYLITGLPSVTYMGMPIMLPHRSLALKDKKLLVDDHEAVNRKQRQEILQRQNPNSIVFSLDELKGATSKDIRAKFAGKEIVYIYHNQIDAIADNKKTEDDVFNATEDAITEIQQLIQRLRPNDIAHFYVTADHGYLYRHDQLRITDKIDLSEVASDIKAPRYLITSQKFDEPGVGHQRLGEILGNDDPRYVYFPKTANVFRSAGSFNYVHGGSSLQEMIVPLLEVKTTSARSVAKSVELELFSMNRQITSLTVPVVIRQSAPIGPTVIPAEFELYFVNDQNQQISGPVTVLANSNSENAKDRMQSIQIILADQYYDKQREYRLIIKNMSTGSMTAERFVMDIADFNNFDL